MKRLLLFLFLMIGFTVASPLASAQEPRPADDAEHEGPPGDRRPNLLAELALSPEQVQQIRTFNQERRPRMMEARRRMGEAMRSLDLAIYADNVSDAEFQARLRDFQTAEADLSRLRFESELFIRRVLTPEQLVHFRDLRRRFAEQRRNRADRRRPLQDRGLRPMQDGPFRRPLN